MGRYEELEIETKAAGRKRKVYSGESELRLSSIKLKTRRLAAARDEALASCCSSNGYGDLVKESWNSLDLEEDNEATVEPLTMSVGDSLDCSCRSCNSDHRRITFSSCTHVLPNSSLSRPSREAEAESTAGPREASPRCRLKMPSEAELEEFFAAAEKNLQQKFIDKYNYDIVKDIPLEGRYEWAQVQPSSKPRRKSSAN